MSCQVWAPTPLSRVTSKIGSGATPRGGKDAYKAEGIALIRSLNVYDFQFYTDDLAFIDEVQANQLSNVVVHPGDILLNITGASVARCCMVPVSVLPARVNQHVAIVRVDEKKAHGKFVYFCINSPRYKHHLLTLAQGGATREALTKQTIEEFEVPLPDLATQRRIASILSAYDDLIENNTRRIAILEEMAQRIYEEWFVRFRFPGHENVRMVESELGLVPEGWKPCPLGTLVEHSIGGGWGKEEAIAEFTVPAYVVRGTDIPDVRGGSFGRAPLRFHAPSNFRSRELRARDIVFEVSGGSKDQPVGRAVMVSDALLSRAQHPTICASFCRLIRADAAQILPELLQLHFDRIYANREIMQYQTQSTGITNFKFTVFLEKEMVLRPAEQVQKRFSEVLLPIRDLVANLGIRNTNLRITRDLLLPKLISGELDVSDLPEPQAAAA